MEKDDEKVKTEFTKELEAQRIADIVAYRVRHQLRFDAFNLALFVAAVGWVFWMGRIYAQREEAATC
jgi:hypothetical protein